jgi:hypothetical protein
MKNRRKIDILKLAIKPAILSPVASLIVAALALPALALIPPPNVLASRPLRPAESVMPHHRNYIDPTPGLAWRQYADADDHVYDPHYNWERADRLAHEGTNAPTIAGTSVRSAPRVARSVVSRNGRNICGMNGTSTWTTITTDAHWRVPTARVRSYWQHHS